ncbi:LamG domain-containing protein, partial [Candidatus Gracilibacteria bacterium]|nr:LamG domain-containing protein [Candidatus Gracilibacteria bacterium]
FLGSRNEGPISWIGTHHWIHGGINGNGAFGLDGRKYTPNLNINTWQHIAITFDGSNVVCYLNGQQVCSKIKSGTQNDIDLRSADLVVGRDLTGSAAFFDGRIDELRIYDRVLSATEVRTIYQVEQ